MPNIMKEINEKEKIGLILMTSLIWGVVIMFVFKSIPIYRIEHVHKEFIDGWVNRQTYDWCLRNEYSAIMSDNPRRMIDCVNREDGKSVVNHSD